MMALSILAVARKLRRLKGSNEAPAWHRVTENFLLVLGATTLLTEELDAPTEYVRPGVEHTSHHR